MLAERQPATGFSSGQNRRYVPPWWTPVLSHVFQLFGSVHWWEGLQKQKHFVATIPRCGYSVWLPLHPKPPVLCALAGEEQGQSQAAASPGGPVFESGSTWVGRLTRPRRIDLLTRFGFPESFWGRLRIHFTFLPVTQSEASNRIYIL